MIATIDVQYDNDEAHAGMAFFRDWTASVPHATFAHHVRNYSEYIPGKFHLREMPVILESMQRCGHAIDLILVDCYVDLDIGVPGLGRRLYDHFTGDVDVVGVAKSRFSDSAHALELMRGDSSRPLFVTAAGISATEAADHIMEMHGHHRIPDLIKLADSIARLDYGT